MFMEKIMEKNSDVGETLIASRLYQKYSDCNISLDGLKTLARRGLCRGYPESMVEYCLEVVIKKNCRRDLYNGDDALDEKRFILDAEFRAIMRCGKADDILWC